MKIKKILLSAVLLLLCLIPAGGTVSADVSWYWVDSDSECTTYIDQNSLIKNGGYFKVWVKSVYQDGHYNMIQYLFYTPTQRLAIVNAAMYDVNGNQTGVYTPSMSEYKWAPITPGSLGSKIYSEL